jgi:hypothetical protein
MAYGSLINAISGSNPELVPEVGMGATVLYWTDRRAATVIEVSASGRQITVQYDKATRTDNHGMSDAQSYEYEADPNGATRVFTKRKNGQWIAKGDSLRGQRLGLGYRRHYYDYSF